MTDLIIKWLILPVAGLSIYLVSKIKNHQTSGIITTTIVHAVFIVLLFILPGFKSDSVFAGEGMEVALGSDMEGGNSNTLAAEGAENSTTPPPEESSNNSLDKEIATDDQSESDVVVPAKDKNTTTTPTKPNKNPPIVTKPAPKVPDRKVDQGSTYHKDKSGKKNGNDGGDPNSPGQGGKDQGNTGDPNGHGKNPDTGSPGTGTDKVQAYLKGRAAKSLPTIATDFEETGILKFEVVVSPSGKVKSVRKIPPSTITNYAQIERMKTLILSKLLFAAKPDAEEEETGSYTIRFERK